ncbi:hypothetical protein SEA_CASSITA_52 [Microbacterium phage Cassita]|nr:hypothetical protein SEA_CASSITA_52 [Microbacterium phage Cassita]
MGVDISMSMGWGIHIPQPQIDSWLEGNDPDEEGADELLNDLIYRENSELTFEYAGNAWVGEDNGFVIYAKDTYKDFDMGRSAEAGVYRAPKTAMSLKARYELDAVSKTITGKHLPIEWLVTVGVS